MKEKRRDRVHLTAVEQSTSNEDPFRHVQDAHHDGGESWPPDPLRRRENLTAVPANPSKSRCAYVALRYGVRGDEPRGPILAQEVEHAAEEVCHEIGVSMALGVR